jgi:hypothetical protein
MNGAPVVDAHERMRAPCVEDFAERAEVSERAARADVDQRVVLVRFQLRDPIEVDHAVPVTLEVDEGEGCHRAMVAEARRRGKG